jgi:predicted RNase H-like nuclease (RuvC/YqgF family)
MFLSIPILGILGSVVREWLSMRGKQVAPARARELEQKLEKMLQKAGVQIRDLEKSKKELEERLESLEATNHEYAQRLENLEAIVVSQDWASLPNKTRQRALPGPEIQDEIPTRPHEVSDPTPEELNRQRAARLARRVGG